MDTSTVDPQILARAQRIIELRHRYGTSGRDGRDMGLILAALSTPPQQIDEQRELFED